MHIVALRVVCSSLSVTALFHFSQTQRELSEQDWKILLMQKTVGDSISSLLLSPRAPPNTVTTYKLCDSVTCVSAAHIESTQSCIACCATVLLVAINIEN